MGFQKFESEITVRPDDIDMNNHVHTSRYFDYYLFARYDQMERCYGIPMEKFLAHGWTWFVKSCQIEFKRPLVMGETVIVRTWLESFEKSEARVRFLIIKKKTGKTAAEGMVLNTMINIASGRPELIPDWVIAQYTRFTD
jgi:YbgC/YbaW family acyl-CoA thioester hydrolase